MKTSLVFNIQRFSVHDGPGIRTTVFLKGCNLRCRWCHNPESISGLPQVLYFPDNCVGCAACAAVCGQGVRVEGKRRMGVERCVWCGACVAACMNDALKLSGREMTPSEVMDVVRKDKDYYDNSGGGLTLSGGEPLLHPEFCAELLEMARTENIHTAIDTAANVPYEAFSAVLPYTQAVLLDLKMMDEELHEKYTGSSNTRILENAQRLFSEAVDLFVRIPLIAGVNDTRENACHAARFLSAAGNLKEVKLLPYHGLGVDKAQSAGLSQDIFAAPDEAALSALAALFPCRVVL